jgi:hypothetical protein
MASLASRISRSFSWTRWIQVDRWIDGWMDICGISRATSCQPLTESRKILDKLWGRICHTHLFNYVEHWPSLNQSFTLIKHAHIRTSARTLLGMIFQHSAFMTRLFINYICALSFAIPSFVWDCFVSILSFNLPSFACLSTCVRFPLSLLHLWPQTEIINRPIYIDSVAAKKDRNIEVLLGRKNDIVWYIGRKKMEGNPDFICITSSSQEDIEEILPPGFCFGSFGSLGVDGNGRIRLFRLRIIKSLC